ncbi:GPI-linked NAD(P)(+)--arginine ADP-ribosyltransferase 1-like [Xyrauchen texanus]|uniref:GPI-linked NAD(P)(+)--arginine ADP-ribosyltransferase 1-like n=1 Tax=Xyrauchen texanus TaxID=154827 RepID=UPI002242BB61|nr:GPI-linked NAD(P)(+)--arginine ADP-ribosyltransferase 1-like [Xyrauchen texanus]
MQTVAALILLITQVALGQDYKVAVKGNIFQLDMAPNSVDDQYDGCREKMSNLVSTVFLEKETSENYIFAAAWKEVKINVPGPEDNLTRNHLITIYMYTHNRVYNAFNDTVHKVLNNAVRNDKPKYINKTYTWYSLQFLLTEAIQILNETQKTCQKTYRGTTNKYDVLNKDVRFGSFASSSLDQTEAEKFGNVSCFEIETCEGAELTKYSAFPYEKEVLIPPYEKFNLTDIKNGSWCDTVYVLKSSGTASNLNCAVASLAP